MKTYNLKHTKGTLVRINPYAEKYLKKYGEENPEISRFAKDNPPITLDTDIELPDGCLVSEEDLTATGSDIYLEDVYGFKHPELMYVKEDAAGKYNGYKVTRTLVRKDQGQMEERLDPLHEIQSLVLNHFDQQEWPEDNKGFVRIKKELLRCRISRLFMEVDSAHDFSSQKFKK
ncbi:MAG: hypothetical protein WC380_00065 [Pedobacter sp.]|jgi:hypothetical protein